VSNQILFEDSPSGKESFGVGEIRIPGSRSFGRVFATIKVGLFYKSLGFYVAFVPTLYIKINASAPNPDGEDIAVQYAYAYIVDPNKFRVSMNENFNGNISIENFAKSVPDGTQVLWRLTKLRNAIDRPFYSTSQRSVSGNAVDKTIDGISQNVVFGPAANINSSIIEVDSGNVLLIPEEYIITATVSYGGATASASQAVCLYPVTVNPDQVLPAISQTSFYFAGKSFGKNSEILRQLIWREFYAHLLYGYPKLLDHKVNNTIRWPYTEEYLNAWMKGKTGFPVVDACMRQLNATGWMHNRGRLIASSFLVKTLLIDWRFGEQYFAKHLVDYDVASNNGNWQWISGTGVD
ncbi:hypothetical protein EBU71_23190, partial [bacterium]|nr:hypothetical protein [Candidatus Elulimicrobium humile]